MLRRSRLIVVLLAILEFAAHHSFAADAPANAEPAGPMKKTAGAITIDGALDEPCWKEAATIRADYVNSKQGVLSDDPRLAVKYTWDEQYLYIGYETFDKNLVALGSGESQGPVDNKRDGCEIYKEGVKVDVVEFFISFGDERFFWEIHHNALNQFNDVWCTVVDEKWPIAKSSFCPYGIIFGSGEYLKDFGQHQVAMAVKMKPKADGKPSTVNDPSDEDTGYTAEIRLPWGSLGAPRALQKKADKNAEPKWDMAGQELIVLAVCQDGDLKERYHHSSPTRKGGWFHTTAALWPRYKLTADTNADGKQK